jgi:hypothetical protein
MNTRQLEIIRFALERLKADAAENSSIAVIGHRIVNVRPATEALLGEIGEIEYPVMDEDIKMAKEQDLPLSLEHELDETIATISDMHRKKIAHKR